MLGRTSFSGGLTSNLFPTEFGTTFPQVAYRLGGSKVAISAGYRPGLRPIFDLTDGSPADIYDARCAKFMFIDE